MKFEDAIKIMKITIEAHDLESKSGIRYGVKVFAKTKVLNKQVQFVLTEEMLHFNKLAGVDINKIIQYRIIQLFDVERLLDEKIEY